MKTSSRTPAVAVVAIAIAAFVQLAHATLTNAASQPIRTFGFGGVVDLAISPTGKEIATCGSRGVVFWDAFNGAFLGALPETQRYLTDTAFSDVGWPLCYDHVRFSAEGMRVLAWGSARATLWDRGMKQVIREWFPEPDGCYPVVCALAPDGRKVLICTYRTASVTDTDTGSILWSLPWDMGSPDSPVAFSLDSNTVLLARHESLECREALTGALVWSARPLPQCQRDIAMVPGGMTFVELERNHANSSSSVRIRRVADGSTINSWPVEHGTSWFSLSPDGKRILLSLGEIRDLESSTLLGTLADPPTEWSRSGARGGFTPDGSEINMVYWGRGQGIGAWDAKSFFWKRELLAATPPGLPSVSSDGSKILLGGQLWGTENGTLLHVFAGGGRTAMTPDNRCAVTETATNGLAIWDLEGKALVRLLDVPSSSTNQTRVTGLAISPLGDVLATATWSWMSTPSGERYDGMVTLFSLPGGNLIRTIHFPNDYIGEVAFSPDGTRLATCTRLGVLVSDVDSGKAQACYLHEGGVGAVAFSADGTRLAAVNGGYQGTFHCQVWDLASSRSVYDYVGFNGSSVAFSPDSRFLLVGGLAGDLWGYESPVYSMATGRKVAAFPPSGGVGPGRLSSATWMPGGKQVLLWNDGVLTLWDARHVLADLRLLNTPVGLQAAWDSGILQYSETINGEWKDLPFSSPVMLATIGKHGFFRVKLE